MENFTTNFIFIATGIMVAVYIAFTAYVIIRHDMLNFEKRKKKRSKNKHYAQKLIPIIISAIVLYTVTSFALQFYNGAEPSSTLTTCFFGFFSVELISLAAIKVKKESSTNQISESEKRFKDTETDNLESDENVEG